MAGLWVLLFAGLVSGQVPEETEGPIRTIVEDVIEAQGLVGTHVIVWHQGETITNEVWGEADAGLGTPANLSTRYLVASVLKSLTALAVMDLVREGLIDLDAPVQTYLPEFPVKPEGTMTTWLLLEHRAGVRHYRRGETANAGFFDTNYETARAAIAKFADDGLVAAPGARVQYSSFGYTLLAAIVESVTDEAYSTYMTRRYFEAFDMDHAEMPDWRFPVDNLATSYSYYLDHLGPTEARGPFQARRLNFSYNAGGGNLVATAQDLVNYGRQYVNGGAIADEHVASIARTDSLPADRLGWHVTQDHAARRVLHAIGASEAYQASITIWPEEELIVVGLSNTWGRDPRSGAFSLSMHRDIGAAVLR